MKNQTQWGAVAQASAKKQLSAKLRLRELAEYKPSDDALQLRAATLAYNKFIGDKKDWMAASNSEKGLGLMGRVSIANNAMQKKGIQSQWHLPFGIGKKAKAWRQYNQDMDWVNTSLSAKLRLRELARQAVKAVISVELNSTQKLVEFAKGDIDVDDIHGNYIEHPGRKRHIVGGIVGAGVGGLAAAAAIKSHHAVPVGALIGAIGGSLLADPHGSSERRRQMREAKHSMREAFQTDAVPVNTIKSKIPIASSYFGVTGELKKQKVGFFKRHGAAWNTSGHRSGENAAFLPYGETGVIVAPKKVPRIVIRHEEGLGKDYKLHGDFKKVYPRYGKSTWDPREYLQNTLLPEERAWRHANPRTEKEKKLKDAALGSYAAGGGFTRKPTTNQP